MHTKHPKTKIVTPIILLMLLISGCFNSNTSNSTPYFTISDEFTDYCWFEKGSYWIFQNDSSLVTDTIKISDVIETKRFHNEQGGFNYQAVELITSANIFNISNYELTAGDFEPESTTMNSLLRLYKNDGSYYLVFLPQYPMGENVIMGDDIGIYKNIELLPTFELNNITYQNVYHTKIEIPLKNSEYNYWVAKYHSLIKTTSTINGQTSSISVKSDNLISK